MSTKPPYRFTSVYDDRQLRQALQANFDHFARTLLESGQITHGDMDPTGGVPDKDFVLNEIESAIDEISPQLRDIADAPSKYVELAGDTMTGGLTMAYAGPQLLLQSSTSDATTITLAGGSTGNVGVALKHGATQRAYLYAQTGGVVKLLAGAGGATSALSVDPTTSTVDLGNSSGNVTSAAPVPNTTDGSSKVATTSWAQSLVSDRVQNEIEAAADQIIQDVGGMQFVRGNAAPSGGLALADEVLNEIEATADELRVDVGGMQFTRSNMDPVGGVPDKDFVTNEIEAAVDEAVADATSRVPIPRVLTYGTSGGTFYKAAYPGMRGVFVRAQGPGGGGGGASTDATCGGGGGAGGYAEAYIPVDQLPTSVTVTVGTGGTAGTSTTSGSAGTSDAAFGTLVVATAGAGGAVNGGSFASGGAGSGGTAQHLHVTGGYGEAGGTGTSRSSRGGDAVLGHGGPHTLLGSGGTSGTGYGSGGAGGHRNTVTSRAGSAGKDGIVIVEVIY